MNKKNIILLVSLVVFSLVTGYSISKKTGKESQIQSSPELLVDTNNLQYELIMNDFFFENKILKPNAALLISNKEEIKADAKMFLSERKSYHLCGYHYRFLFWTNTDSLFGKTSVNERCEAFGYQPIEANKKLAYYIKQLESAPTHYIYSLKIPVSIEPNEIRAKLKDAELHLFFIDGEQTRLPSICFSYYSKLFVKENAKNNDWEKAYKENEEAAKKKFKELVEKVKSISSIVEVSDMRNTLSGGLNDYAYRRDYIDITFQKGTDLSKIVMLLEQEGAKVERQNNPSTYCVQVVDTSDNIKYIKDKLKQYVFIEKITEYKSNE